MSARSLRPGRPTAAKPTPDAALVLNVKQQPAGPRSSLPYLTTRPISGRAPRARAGATARSIFGLYRLRELCGDRRYLLIRASNLEHVRARRHRPQTHDRSVEALPERLRAAPSGVRSQLIRRCAVSLTRGRPLKARFACLPADPRGLAGAACERGKPSREAKVGRSHLVSVDRRGPGEHALLELIEDLPIAKHSRITLNSAVFAHLAIA